MVKGRFGHEFINSPDRLQTPMIRRGGKNGTLEPATWEEAIQVAADGLNKVKEKYGAEGIGAFCSSRATNEDNYVFHRFVRTVLNTNNIDHCARLCHMASAVALEMSVGSSAPSASTPDIRMADAFIVVGSNTTETHPVISSAVLKAKYEDGAKLVVVDPRRIEMVDHADIWLRPKVGTNVAVLNAIANVIIAEGMVNEAFVNARTEDYEAFKANVEKYTPEYVEEISEVPADRIVEAARAYGKAQRGMLLWGMGITQHLTGVQGALALSNLMLLTGHVGRPRFRLHSDSRTKQCARPPATCKASTMPCQAITISMILKIAPSSNKHGRAPLPTNEGLTVVEMEEAGRRRQDQGHVHHGGKPDGQQPGREPCRKGVAQSGIPCRSRHVLE